MELQTEKEEGEITINAIEITIFIVAILYTLLSLHGWYTHLRRVMFLMKNDIPWNFRLRPLSILLDCIVGIYWVFMVVSHFVEG